MTGFEFQKPKTRDGIAMRAQSTLGIPLRPGRVGAEHLLVAESQAEDLVRRLHRLFFQPCCDAIRIRLLRAQIRHHSREKDSKDSSTEPRRQRELKEAPEGGGQ